MINANDKYSLVQSPNMLQQRIFSYPINWYYDWFVTYNTYNAHTKKSIMQICAHMAYTNKQIRPLILTMGPEHTKIMNFMNWPIFIQQVCQFIDILMTNIYDKSDVHD